MRERPIGVFDSGLGGLTVVKRLLRALPHEDILYFGDTGRVPYGTRSRETIRKYAAQDMQFLLSNQVKMVIAACGTVSSVAGDIGAGLPLPYTGVLAPASRAAAAATKNGRIGVIGTPATINSRSYSREIAAIDPSLLVLEQDCPLFVPLVENGFVEPGDQVARLVAEKYLLPLCEQQVDTLILGCTHFPILADTISAVMGPRVALIDAGGEAANWAAAMLQKEGLENPRQTAGACRFFVSDHIDGFARIGGMFLGREISEQVSFVDLSAFDD